MSDLGPSALVIGQGIGAFQFFLPKLSEVRKADATTNPDIVGDVRMGEIAAVVVCIGVGAMTSAITKSAMPAYAAAFVGIALVCVYESVLRADRPGNPKPTRRSTDA
jgi:hypothetical protein